MPSASVRHAISLEIECFPMVNTFERWTCNECTPRWFGKPFRC